VWRGFNLDEAKQNYFTGGKGFALPRLFFVRGLVSAAQEGAGGMRGGFFGWGLTTTWIQSLFSDKMNLWNSKMINIGSLEVGIHAFWISAVANVTNISVFIKKMVQEICAEYMLIVSTNQQYQFSRKSLFVPMVMCSR